MGQVAGGDGAVDHFPGAFDRVHALGHLFILGSVILVQVGSTQLLPFPCSAMVSHGLGVASRRPKRLASLQQIRIFGEYSKDQKASP